METLKPAEAKIIDRGRGPEIAGTRITVFDVMDYLENGWHRTHHRESQCRRPDFLGDGDT